MLKDTTVVLTGGTSGIGLAAARCIARTAKILIIQGPEPEQLLTDLGSQGKATIRYYTADFTSLNAVHIVANNIRNLIDKIDVQINNAGVPGSPFQMLTKDGNKRTLQVNYLSLIVTLTDAPASHTKRITHS